MGLSISPGRCADRRRHSLGIGIAFALTRVMSGFLFGVGPMDPATYAAVSATLAIIALVAYLPARRASRVDPIAALRMDV